MRSKLKPTGNNGRHLTRSLNTEHIESVGDARILFAIRLVHGASRTFACCCCCCCTCCCLRTGAGAIDERRGFCILQLARSRVLLATAAGAASGRWLARVELAPRRGGRYARLEQMLMLIGRLQVMPIAAVDRVRFGLMLRLLRLLLLLLLLLLFGALIGAGACADVVGAATTTTAADIVKRELSAEQVGLELGDGRLDVAHRERLVVRDRVDHVASGLGLLLLACRHDDETRLVEVLDVAAILRIDALHAVDLRLDGDAQRGRLEYEAAREARQLAEVARVHEHVAVDTTGALAAAALLARLEVGTRAEAHSTATATATVTCVRGRLTTLTIFDADRYCCRRCCCCCLVVGGPGDRHGL